MADTALVQDVGGPIAHPLDLQRDESYEEAHEPSEDEKPSMQHSHASSPPPYVPVGACDMEMDCDVEPPGKDQPCGGAPSSMGMDTPTLLARAHAHADGMPMPSSSHVLWAEPAAAGASGTAEDRAQLEHTSGSAGGPEEAQPAVDGASSAACGEGGGGQPCGSPTTTTAPAAVPTSAAPVEEPQNQLEAAVVPTEDDGGATGAGRAGDPSAAAAAGGARAPEAAARPLFVPSSDATGSACTPPASGAPATLPPLDDLGELSGELARVCAMGDPTTATAAAVGALAPPSAPDSALRSGEIGELSGELAMGGLTAAAAAAGAAAAATTASPAPVPSCAPPSGELGERLSGELAMGGPTAAAAAAGAVAAATTVAPASVRSSAPRSGEIGELSGELAMGGPTAAATAAAGAAAAATTAAPASMSSSAPPSDELSELRAEVVRLRALAPGEGAELARVRAVRDELSRESGQYKGEIAKLTGAVVSRDRHIAQQAAELASLRASAAAAQQELSAVRIAATVTPERVRDSLRSLRGETERAAGSAAGAESRAAALARLLAAETEEAADVQAFSERERAALAAHAASLEGALDAERAECAWQRQAAGAGAARAEGLAAECDTLRGDVYHAKERCAELAAELGHVQEQLAAALADARGARAAAAAAVDGHARAAREAGEAKDLGVRLFKQMRGILHALEKQSATLTRQAPEVVQLVKSLTDWTQRHQGTLAGWASSAGGSGGFPGAVGGGEQAGDEALGLQDAMRDGGWRSIEGRQQGV